MNKSITLIFVLIFLTASCIIIILPVKASGDSWVSKAPMQVARAGLGVAVINGKIYAIGGSTQVLQEPRYLSTLTNLGSVDTNEQYDPATNTWTFKSPMPTPRVAFGISVYQDKIYCIGGKNTNGDTAVNEVYDPATDTWETKAPVPAAGAAQAKVVNGKIYLISYGRLYAYDPLSDSWTEKKRMSIVGDYGASVIFDGKIYVLGGVDYLTYASFPAQIYDPETDSWSAVASYPQFVVFGRVTIATTGTFAPKQIYMIGTRTRAETAQLLFPNQVYNPQENKWTLGATMLTGRVNFGFANINDAMYTIGGYTYGLYSDKEGLYWRHSHDTILSK